MKPRGKKSCPNCNEFIRLRTRICLLCGYNYETKTVMEKLPEKKNNKGKIYDKMGPGKKMCPECHSIIGSVSKNCPKCKFDFKAFKEQVKIKEQKEKEEEKNNKAFKEKYKKQNTDIQDKILAKLEQDRHNIIKSNIKMTPDLHADRIIAYGEERARSLYNLRKSNGGWKHVNWKKVAEHFQLNCKEEYIEENVEENSEYN